MESMQVISVCLHTDAAVRLLVAVSVLQLLLRKAFCHLQFFHNQRVVQEPDSDVQVGQHHDVPRLSECRKLTVVSCSTNSHF